MTPDVGWQDAPAMSRFLQRVNGLLLPVALAEALGEGRWSGRPDARRLSDALGVNAPAPRLYGLESIERVNRTWHRETREVYIGRPSTDSPPGDIDPLRSILIGDLEPEAMLALDYRADSQRPTVVCCCGDGWSPWRLMANSVEEFMAKTGL
jgi:hypothetical protein